MKVSSKHRLGSRFGVCLIGATFACGWAVPAGMAQAPQLPSSVPASALPAAQGMLPGSSVGGLPGASAVMNQPVVLNSSENVEMERLRMMQEAGKLEREEAAFRELSSFQVLFN